MKAKVKLFANRRKDSSTGRMYDIYEISAPYSIRQHEEMQHKDVSTALDISAKRAYTPSYRQAGLFLRAIQYNQREQLSQECLLHLANYVVQAWEADPTEARVTDVVQVMSHLLRTTGIDPKSCSLDDALRITCRNTAAIPTVCPSFTLLVAIRYIDRLKRKYRNIRGAEGCSHRLVVVAYMMAVKFIHANLRLVVDTTTPLSTTCPTVGRYYYPESTERSTLQPPDPATMSPPASPKSDENDDDDDKRAKSQRVLRALRMEIEFLHFLSYDLTLTDPASLIVWAQQLQKQKATTENTPHATQ